VDILYSFLVKEKTGKSSVIIASFSEHSSYKKLGSRFSKEPAILRAFLYTHLKIRNDDDWERIKIQALTNPRKSRQAGRQAGRERGKRERINQKQAAEKAETNGPDSKGHDRT